MKIVKLLKSRGMVLTASLMASTSLVFAQTATTNLNSFSSSQNTEGVTPVGCGSAYGAGSIVWDNQGEPASIGLYPGTTGAAYVNVGYSLTDTSWHPITDFICFPPYDNWYWSGNGNVNLALYSAVQFDVLWDTVNSTASISNFDNPATLGFGSGSYPGLQVDYVNGAGDAGTIASGVQIPNAASNGWATVTIPINAANLSANVVTNCGIMLFYWLNNESNALVKLGYTPAAYFWIANVNYIGTEGPPPPPRLQVPSKPVQGLNVFASTPGIYDRQEVALVASNGVSWVGKASAANPVTYSFTIDGFPQNPATRYACEAYLIMSPNPAAYDSALDYNEPNAVNVYLQQGAGTTLMTFQYKTNEPSSETYNTIGTVTNTGTALGTWSITFTSDTNVTMTAPNGNTSSFLFTNASYFAETANPGMYLYLGMQPNNTAGINQAVCYSQFSISGVPAAMSDNFAADSSLNATNWIKFMATGPGGIFVMPPGAQDWVSWSLPAAGFQFQTATNLSGPWTVAHDFGVSGVGESLDLVTTNDIPAGAPAAYFDMANP